MERAVVVYLGLSGESGKLVFADVGKGLNGRKRVRKSTLAPVKYDTPKNKESEQSTDGSSDRDDDGWRGIIRAPSEVV